MFPSTLGEEEGLSKVSRWHFAFLRFQIHCGDSCKILIPREIPTHSNLTLFYELFNASLPQAV